MGHWNNAKHEEALRRRRQKREEAKYEWVSESSVNTSTTGFYNSNSNDTSTNTSIANPSYVKRKKK